MPDDKERPLNVKQAAEEIGMSQAWLYDRIRKGLGPKHKKRGSKIFIKKTDLQTWDAQAVLP